MGGTAPKGWTMNVLLFSACIVLAIISFKGIVSDKFHDNSMQRIGMGGIIIASLAFANQILCDKTTLNFVIFELFIFSSALYAIATAWKYTYGR